MEGQVLTYTVVVASKMLLLAYVRAVVSSRGCTAQGAN